MARRTLRTTRAISTFRAVAGSSRSNPETSEQRRSRYLTVFAWTTSWGVTTRLIGTVVMMHGDDDGAILPPRVAPAQIVILPVTPKEDSRAAVHAAAHNLAARLREQSFHGEPLRAALSDFRKFTGRQLSDYCAKAAPACFAVALRQAAGEDRERRFWQPTRHPEVIESQPFWQQKFDYLHDNPRRKGLVVRGEHWRFSSAAYYASDGRETYDVPISGFAW